LFSGEFEAVDNYHKKINQWDTINRRNKSMGTIMGTFTVPLTVERLTHRKVWKKLSIKPGSYYDCVMPENVQSLWGPVPLKRLPEGVDNACKAVTHE
jgi:hypothetical protein